MKCRSFAFVVFSLLVSVPGAPADDAAYVAQILESIPKATWDRYKALNAAETRLAEYRDSDSSLAVKLRQLAVINASRARFRVQAVELDILASRVANRQSMEAAQNGFHGHWNLRGEKPYHRYAFAGGTDHVSENASYSSTTGEFTRSLDFVATSMEEAHGRFMAERAPNDGHKQNCIGKDHNYVGIGFYLAKSTFAYYEEFLDRYIELIDPPFTASAGKSVEVAVRPLATGYYPYAALTYYEAMPKAMSVAQVNAKGSYPDYTDTQGNELWPWDLETGADGVTRITLSFPRAGLYYLQFYLDTKKPDGQSASTEGRIQASGLVVRVQ